MLLPLLPFFFFGTPGFGRLDGSQSHDMALRGPAVRGRDELAQSRRGAWGLGFGIWGLGGWGQTSFFFLGGVYLLGVSCWGSLHIGRKWSLFRLSGLSCLHVLDRYRMLLPSYKSPTLLKAVAKGTCWFNRTGDRLLLLPDEVDSATSAFGSDHYLLEQRTHLMR